MMRAYQRDRGTNLKEFPMAKSAKVWARNDDNNGLYRIKEIPMSPY